jgi:hypothetical protein
MVDDDLMSASEVAITLGVTISNLRQIQHRKHLCWVSRVGRKVYYRRDEVEAYRLKREARHGRQH